MRLLLDTHVVIAASRRRLDERYPVFVSLLARPDSSPVASVAAIWEITIKARIGKLEIGVPLEDLSALLRSLGMTILPIEHRHATAQVNPEPDTRDPFDRMLLAQCAVENLKLLTVDRALVDHPLAWREET